jgi:hypothetical protein
MSTEAGRILAAGEKLPYRNWTSEDNAIIRKADEEGRAEIDAALLDDVAKDVFIREATTPIVHDRAMEWSPAGAACGALELAAYFVKERRRLIDEAREEAK